MSMPRSCDMFVNFAKFLPEPDLYVRKKSELDNPKHLYPRTYDDFHAFDLNRGCAYIKERDPCTDVKCPKPCCINYLELNDEY